MSAAIERPTCNSASADGRQCVQHTSMNPSYDTTECPHVGSRSKTPTIRKGQTISKSKSCSYAAPGNGRPPSVASLFLVRVEIDDASALGSHSSSMQKSMLQRFYSWSDPAGRFQCINMSISLAEYRRPSRERVPSQFFLRLEPMP